MNIIRRNNVKTYGKGEQAIIFAHGFGCSQNMWRLVAPAFADEYQVVLFDYVGAGGSDTAAYNRSRYLSLHDYAEDIVELCSALDLEKSIFVGHSVSSMIGMLAAIKAPQFFERLVMVGPSPCYINEQDYKGGFDRQKINQLLTALDSNFKSWSEAMAPVIMGNNERPELAAELVQASVAPSRRSPGTLRRSLFSRIAEPTFQP